MKRSRAFTLIELLVVVSIIALLVSILLPSLSRARGHAQQVICLANTRTACLGAMMYVEDFDGRFMTHRSMIGLDVDWHSCLVPYLSEQEFETNYDIRRFTEEGRRAYFQVWWDLLCPRENPASILQNTLSYPLIYGYHMGGDERFLPAYNGMTCLYSDGYGVYDFGTGKSRKVTEVHPEGLMFSEMLYTDYMWSTIVSLDGVPNSGHGGMTMDLSNRHPRGNAGAFCDGHARMIAEDEFRDPTCTFWKVKR